MAAAPKISSAGRVALALAGCLAAAAFAGCAAPSSDMQQLQNNEYALRGMVANDRQQLDALQEQVAHLNDRLSEVEHNGGGGSGGETTGLAALNQRVSKLEAQAAQPPAAPGLPAAADTSGPGAAADAGMPGAPADDIASAGPPGSPANAAPSASAAASPSWRSSIDQELAARHDDQGAKLYRAGLVDLKGGRYPQALAKFQDLQRRYPKSGLSEPAEYFSANALYEMGKYDQSILQFNDLTMRFPRGKYSSPALLREAQAFMQINDRIDARLTLQKLINDHPDSPEAASAKSMMQTLAS
jgi:tol-pal system protein YbgF